MTIAFFQSGRCLIRPPRVRRALPFMTMVLTSTTRTSNAFSTASLIDRDCDALQVDASGAPVPLETPAPPVVRRTPPPQLLIVGNQIQNTYGERVVLRGVAIDQPTLLANSPRVGHFAAEDYRVLADDWGANIIRVPVYPRSWTSDPLYMEKYLDQSYGTR